MKKIFIILFAALTGFTHGATKTMSDLKWFQSFECDNLTLTRFHSASDKKVEKQISITDQDYINSFQIQISRLPTKGEMMIKMGPNAGYLTLDFRCAGKIETIQFYNSKIKTPGTSFLENNDDERKIWNEIQSHFDNPAINKAHPQVKGRKYSYEGFSIEFLGSEDRTPKGTTASLYVDSFRVVSTKDKKEQVVEVSSGQLPPGPEKFVVDGQTLVIDTFTGKDGVRLEPRMYIIYKE